MSAYVLNLFIGPKQSMQEIGEGTQCLLMFLMLAVWRVELAIKELNKKSK